LCASAPRHSPPSIAPGGRPRPGDPRRRPVPGADVADAPPPGPRAAPHRTRARFQAGWVFKKQDSAHRSCIDSGPRDHAPPPRAPAPRRASATGCRGTWTCAMTSPCAPSPGSTSTPGPPSGPRPLQGSAGRPWTRRDRRAGFQPGGDVCVYSGLPSFLGL